MSLERAILLVAIALLVFAGSFAQGQLGNSPTAGTKLTEAFSGFDNVTNGSVPQADFDAAKGVFEEQEKISDGLGPVYNAQSCGECHQNPVTGGISQITELR